MTIAKIQPFHIDPTKDFTFGNTLTGNLKTDNLLYANGDPYVFTSSAAGANTQIQFNDGNSFAGDANLTFDKTTGTLTATNITGNITIGINNLKISGGTANYVLQTDGAGNLAWAEMTGGSGSGSTTPGDVKLDTFVANGTQTNFTLSVSPQGKKYSSIHIDGIYQTSNIYSLSGNVLTLIEAPAANSIIEVRTIVTGQIAGDQPGITSVGVLDGLTVSGNILPDSNIAYDLGSDTHRFRDLYLSGNTLFFGGASLKTDDNTGAVTIIPKSTSNIPNPTALIITSEGMLATAETVNGEITANAILTASANASVVDSATVSIAGTAPETTKPGSMWYDNVNTGELYVYDGNAWVSTSIVPMTNAEAPVLSGVNQAAEGANVPITITNYNSQYAYVITTSGGYATRTNNTIYWILPSVSSNTAMSMTVQSVYNGVSWSLTTKNLTVINSAINDTAIVISNFGYRDLNIGWI